MRFGALGDLVQCTALLSRLWRASGLPCDLVTGHPGAPSLLSGLPFVGEVIVVPSRRRPYPFSPAQRRLVARLRARPPSVVVLFEAVEAVRPKLRRLLRRGKVGAGQLIDAGDLARAPLEHTLDFLDRLGQESCRRIGWSGRFDPTGPALAVLPAERDECRQWLADRGLADRRILVVHPGSRRGDRGRWAEADWTAALDRILASDPALHAVISGSAQEAGLAASIQAGTGSERVLSAAGDLPLRRLLSLLSMADSFIGLDSGPAHMAPALECPAVVLFGRADPRRVAPRGTAPVACLSGLPEADWPDDPDLWAQRNRMAAIEVDAVLEAWLGVQSGAAK